MPKAKKGLRLSKDIYNHAITKLCDANTEAYAFLRAIADCRFEGVDPSQACIELSVETEFAFELLMERIMPVAKSYKKKCDENPMPGKKSEDPNAIGGDLLLQSDSVRLIADVVGKDTNIGLYFRALHQIQFENTDPDIVESALPKLPRYLFIMSRNGVLENKTGYDHLVATNRQNAARKNKSHSAPASTVPDLVTIDTANIDVACPGPNSTDAIPTASVPAEVLVSAADSVDSSNPVSSSAKNAMYDIYVGEFERTAANCSELQRTAPNNNININKENLSLSTYPQIRAMGESDLRIRFNKLLNAYPKQQQPETAWAVFRGLNPDESTFNGIMTGLRIAQQDDIRFQGEFRYIPLLSNWLRGGGWQRHNMHLAADPSDRYRPANTAADYLQRPPLTQAEQDARIDRTLQQLADRYGYPCADE